jgi:hypothetical protein
LDLEHKPRLGPVAADQRGQAALIAVLLVVVGSAAFMYTLATPAKISLENDRKTAAALAQAKEALIGRAATDVTRPGSLPCPDIDNDGIAESPVAFGGVCPSYIGRLPWKTLGVQDLRDGGGERLWYALTPSFRDHMSGGILNSDTPGQLTVTGTAPAGSVIAILFAPGPVVVSQARDTANQNNVANYLEGGNETGIATYTFVTGQATSTFNDELLAITSDALFSVVGMRVAREVRSFLTAYFNANGYYPFATRYTDPTYSCTLGVTSGRIPSPAPLLGLISTTCLGLVDWLGPAQPPAWFAANNWHHVTHYAVAPTCTFPISSLITPCPPGALLTVQNLPAPNNDKRAIVIVTGRALSGQTRPCSGPADCLEDPGNTDGGDTDTIFIKPALAPTNNDRLVVVSP